ncbi:hypothetical protein MMC18_008474 [Xylographa bjoerkii]|nr:hypothetical protein [Xylographa bjoerkii]
MINLQRVNAATANVTNTSFAHKISLTSGPFGLQELRSVFSFPASNGRSWTLSVQTSDLAAMIFTILVLTFAIDHYLYNSRYLIHIGCGKRVKGHAAALDEKASLHEKEALNVESGQKRSNDKNSDLKPESEHDSDPPASSTLPRWVRRAIWISVILVFLANGCGGKEKAFASETEKETLERSSVKAGVEGETDTSPPTRRWGKLVQHPWSQAISSSVILFVAFLAMLGVFTYHLLFWPAMLAVLILLQCDYYQYSNDSAIVPWQSIALKSTLHLAIWMIIGMTLLLKPNRFQGVLRTCFKWTQVVNWWLFWAVMEPHSVGVFVAKRFGFYYPEIMMEVMFIVRPSLVAYLYSGTVCDAVVAVRLCKYFWNDDVMK